MNGLILIPTGGRAGVTLLELVVVLSVVALAAAVTVPSVSSLRRTGEAGAAAREMLLTMRAARWRAVVTGSSTRIVTFARQGDTAVWYVVERQDGAVWIPEGAGHRVPEGVRMTTTGPAVKHFSPRGTSNMGSVVFEAAGGGSYRLSLNPATGRARLYRGENEVGYDG
jgi:prepilin-type N-terminal cleavage/methylation domain-containing protein